MTQGIRNCCLRVCLVACILFFVYYVDVFCMHLWILCALVLWILCTLDFVLLICIPVLCTVVEALIYCLSHSQVRVFGCIEVLG